MTTEEKCTKEKVSEQTEMGSVWETENGNEFENMSEMNNMMAKEGCEMEEENWQKDRRWMTDDVRASINGRKYKNREYMNMRRLYWVNDEIA